METESDFNASAVSGVESNGQRSYGLMQLIPTTAHNLGYAGPDAGLLDPETSINFGTKLLNQLRRTYGDDIKRVYSAYNSGRPDLYLTSSQVAAHVNRLVVILEKQTAAFFASPAVKTAAGPALAGVAVAALLLFWKVKKT